MSEVQVGHGSKSMSVTAHSPLIRKMTITLNIGLVFFLLNFVVWWPSMQYNAVVFGYVSSI